jgi:uncharacterized membrane protein HdeD (DUF308 family)
MLFVGLTTVVSLVFFGAGLIAVGICEIIHAFAARGWRVLGRILIGLLYFAAGVVVIDRPVTASAFLTLFIGVFLIADGFARVVGALVSREGRGAWRLIHGLLAGLFGYLLLANWPVSAFWFIGLVISLELLLNGWDDITIGLAARRLERRPKAPSPQTAEPAHVAV